ncbi:MAG: hypothetical protein NVS2B3_15120 [Vulcanimicrobiaceae bacterium]
MLASVSRLTPRFSTFAEALESFRAAHYRRSLSQLHGIDSIAASTLRARTHLRLGNPRAVRDELADVSVSPARERAEVALLLGVAYSRLGNVDLALDAMRDAFAYCVSSMDYVLEAEIEYYRGLTALGENDLIEGREAASRGLAIAKSSLWSAQNVAAVVPAEHVVSRLLELVALLDATEGRYAESSSGLRESLAVLDRCTVRDAFQEGYALRNLSIIARDFDMEDDAYRLLQRVSAFEWTDDIRAVEFAAVEALGWCAALRGDDVGALQQFRRGQAIASTAPERITISVDRALLAREAGYRAMMVEEIEHALIDARLFEWETAAGDSRDALLALTQVAAASVPTVAREMLDRYTKIRNAMDKRYIARIEPRVRAEEDYSHGLVLRAENRLAASAERLQAAFETWKQIGYEWRAGRAALELAELDAGDIFRLAVRRELSRRPRSVFATRARLVA